MRSFERRAVAKLLNDSLQPRSADWLDPGVVASLLSLGENMKSHGQLVPVIVYGEILLDGERRWRAAQLVGITELDCIVLSERPTEAELRILQYSIEAHKVGLSPMERSHFLNRIRRDNNWQITELADRLDLKQPLVSKLIAYQRLCPAAQQMLHCGELDMEKAYVISQEPDATKQMELLKRAQNLTREQFRRVAHGNGERIDLKASNATFRLPTVVVIVRGKQLSLDGAIEALAETIRQLRQCHKEHFDICTAQRVLADRSKAHN